MNTLVSSDFMIAMGWTLVHAIWQIALLIIVYFVTSRFIQLTAQKKYVLASLTMLAILIWPAASFYSSWNTLQQNHEMKETVSAVNVNDDFLANEGIDVETSFSLLTPNTLEAQNYLPWVVVLWLIGVVFLFIRFLSSHLYLARLKKRNVRALPEAWQLKCNMLAQRMGIKKYVLVWISKAISEPMTFGYFKPVVLLPMEILTGLSTEQIEAILTHELAHIRRADFLINMFQSLMEILFFYHPGVWWLSSQMRKEREMACDDFALQYCPNVLVYAEALTETQRIQRSIRPGLALYASGNSSDFTDRIQRLFQHNGPGSKRTNAGIMAIVAIAIFIMSLANYFLLPDKADKWERLPVVTENEATWVITPETRSEDIYKGVSILKKLGAVIYVETMEFRGGSRGLNLSDLEFSFQKTDEYIRFSIEGLDEVKIVYEKGQKLPLIVWPKAEHSSATILEQTDLIVGEKMTLAELRAWNAVLAKLNTRIEFSNWELDKNGFVEQTDMKVSFSDGSVNGYVDKGTQLSFYHADGKALPICHLSNVDLEKIAADVIPKANLTNQPFDKNHTEANKKSNQLVTYYALDGELLPNATGKSSKVVLYNLIRSGKLSNIATVVSLTGKEANDTFGVNPENSQVIHWLSGENERSLHEARVIIDNQHFTWQQFLQLDLPVSEVDHLTLYSKERSQKEFGLDKVILITTTKAKLVNGDS